MLDMVRGLMRWWGGQVCIVLCNGARHMPVGGKGGIGIELQWFGYVEPRLPALFGLVASGSLVFARLSYGD